jgi:hypothetical protein
VPTCNDCYKLAVKLLFFLSHSHLFSKSHTLSSLCKPQAPLHRCRGPHDRLNLVSTSLHKSADLWLSSSLSSPSAMSNRSNFLILCGVVLYMSFPPSCPSCVSSIATLLRRLQSLGSDVIHHAESCVYIRLAATIHGVSNLTVNQQVSVRSIKKGHRCRPQHLC